MSSEEFPGPAAGRPRVELLVQRGLRRGYLLLAAGLIIPMAALVASGIGYRLRDYDRRAAIFLMTAGVLIFTVRLAIYLR